MACHQGLLGSIENCRKVCLPVAAWDGSDDRLSSNMDSPSKKQDGKRQFIMNLRC